MNKRRRFDKQFRVDAVMLLEASGKTAMAIVIGLGIPHDSLPRWKREFQEADKKTFPGHRDPRNEEVDCLLEENGELRMERDILKRQ